MKNLLLSVFLLLSGISVASAGGHAKASGEKILEMIGGNTVQGSMLSGSKYTEYYAEDGMIRGDGYTGTWRVVENQMCFKYGEDPEYCWSVEIEGEDVTWIADGKKDGTGTIVIGNPNNF